MIKKIKFWSVLMLAVMTLSVMVACGNDDEDNSPSAYTEAEIVDILTGNWGVYGEARVTAYDTNETVTDSYKGTIEFGTNKTVKFKITEATQKVIYTSYIPDGFHYTYEHYIEELFIDNYYKYSILRKGGKNYICFGSSDNPFAFEIVSLKKNTFMLRLDNDIYNYKDQYFFTNIILTVKDKSKATGHAYMTVVSN